MIKLQAPFTEDKIRSLKVGDMVEITGVVFTGRDAVHKYLHDGGEPPVSFKDGIIYHCGPVVLKKKGKWTVTAAGPTTSIREEPYQAAVIGKYGFAGVVGKGGMGLKTLAGLKEHGAVYLHAHGGAAQVLAQRVVRVLGVKHLEELGVPEAMWIYEVKDFPLIVTMDSHGASLHEDVKKSSKEVLDRLLGRKPAA